MLANHNMCREHGRLSLRFDYNIPKSRYTYPTISNLSYMLFFGTQCVTTLIICLITSQHSATTSIHGSTPLNEMIEVSIMAAKPNSTGYKAVPLPSDQMTQPSIPSFKACSLSPRNIIKQSISLICKSINQLSHPGQLKARANDLELMR